MGLTKNQKEKIRNYIFELVNAVEEIHSTIGIILLCKKHRKHFPTKRCKMPDHPTEEDAWIYAKGLFPTLPKKKARSAETDKKKISDYRQYLKSKHWKDKRNKIRKQRCNKCERCKSTIKLQVHHKTYERIGCEKDEDLELLCEICHIEEHKLLRKQGTLLWNGLTVPTIKN